MFGMPPWIEVPLWFLMSFAVAMSVSVTSIRKYGSPNMVGVGFFTGCALGPISIMASATPATKGSRRALFFGGLVGTLVYLRLLGVI